MTKTDTEVQQTPEQAAAQNKRIALETLNERAVSEMRADASHQSKRLLMEAVKVM